MPVPVYRLAPRRSSADRRRYAVSEFFSCDWSFRVGQVAVLVLVHGAGDDPDLSLNVNSVVVYAEKSDPFLSFPSQWQPSTSIAEAIQVKVQCTRNHQIVQHYYFTIKMTSPLL